MYDYVIRIDELGRQRLIIGPITQEFLHDLQHWFHMDILITSDGTASSPHTRWDQAPRPQRQHADLVQAWHEKNGLAS